MSHTNIHTKNTKTYDNCIPEAYALPGARPEFPATKVSGGGGTFGALTMTWKVCNFVYKENNLRVSEV